MILTIRKNSLPPHCLHLAKNLQQKNRVQCQKYFYGFPKRQYSDFCIQVARIVKRMKKLNDFYRHGKYQRARLLISRRSKVISDHNIFGDRELNPRPQT